MSFKVVDIEATQVKDDKIWGDTYHSNKDCLYI